MSYINEFLESLAKYGLELMVSENANHASIQVIPSSSNSEFRMKCSSKKPESFFVKGLPSYFDRNAMNQLLDQPMMIDVSMPYLPTSDNFKEIVKHNRDITISIESNDGNAETFLDKYQKDGEEVTISHFANLDFEKARI